MFPNWTPAPGTIVELAPDEKLPPPVAVCNCGPGSCVASPDGRRIGRVSAVSDIRCKATVPAAAATADAFAAKLNEVSTAFATLAESFKSLADAWESQR